MIYRSIIVPSGKGESGDVTKDLRRVKKSALKLCSAHVLHPCARLEWTSHELHFRFPMAPSAVYNVHDKRSYQVVSMPALSCSAARTASTLKARAERNMALGLL